MTLSEFVRDQYFPMVLGLMSQKAVQGSSRAGGYLFALKFWCHYTGDPPLGEIDGKLLDEFEVKLRLRSFGHTPTDGERELSPKTVEKLLRNICVLLHYAGART